MARLAALLAVTSLVALMGLTCAQPNEPATKHGYYEYNQPQKYGYDHGGYYGRQGPEGYGSPYDRDGPWGPGRGGPDGRGRHFIIDAFGIPTYIDAFARKFPAMKQYQPDPNTRFSSPSTALYPNFFTLTCTPEPAGPQGVFPGPTTPTIAGLAGLVSHLDDVTPVGPIPYTLWDQSATLLGALGATSCIELFSTEYGGCPTLPTNITLCPYVSEEEENNPPRQNEDIPMSNLNVYSIVVKPQWPVDARYFSEYFNTMFSPRSTSGAKIASSVETPNAGDSYGGKTGGPSAAYGGGYGRYDENQLAVGIVLYGVVEGEGQDGNLYRGTVTSVIDLYLPLDGLGDLLAQYGGLLVEYLLDLSGGGGGGSPPPRAGGGGRANITLPDPIPDDILTNNALFITIRNIFGDKLKLASMSESNNALTVQPQQFHFELENLGPADDSTRRRLAKRRAAAKSKKAAAGGGAKKSA